MVKDLLTHVLSGGNNHAVLLNSDCEVMSTTGDVGDFLTTNTDSDIQGVDISTIIPFPEHVKRLIQSGGDYDLNEEIITKRERGYRQVLTDHDDGLELHTHNHGDTPVQFVISVMDLPSNDIGVTTVVYFDSMCGEEIPPAQYKRLLQHNTDFLGEVVSNNEVTELDVGFKTNDIDSTQIQDTDNIFTAVHPDDKDVFDELISETLHNAESSSIHCRFKSEDGDWRMYEVTTHPKKHYPVIDQTLVTARDITGQYFFEQRRQVINRVLRHDLRNDMNVVTGHAEILTSVEDEEIKKHAEVIKKKSEHLVSLGEEVRSIDQELNRTSRRKRQVNVQRVVNEVVKEIHEQYSEATFRVSADELFIVGNSLFRTAVRHIIENAVEHNHRPESDVIVKVECLINDDEMVEIRVTDNGPGIPKGEREVIGNGVETQLDHISGLGLWMVKWIMDSINGEVSFTDGDLSGTEVVLQAHPSSFSPGLNQDDDPDSVESPDPVGDGFSDDIDDMLGSSSRSDSEIKTTTRD